MLTGDAFQALQRIFGEERVSTDVVDLECYSRDASENRLQPAAVVWPERVEEVVAVVRWANEYRVPLAPRGAGTCLCGGPLIEGGVVVDLTRMNRILSICEDDLYCEVEAGVVWSQLQQELTRRGLWLPPDPASGDACTIGGCLACNAGGMRALKYGTFRDWVLGLTVVLGYGALVQTGGRTHKHVSGYDLTRLLVGSEGTLGVIVAARLRVAPQPDKRATVFLAFEDVEAAARSVHRVRMRGLQPSAAELLDRRTVAAVNAYLGDILPEAEAVILLEFDGTAAAVDELVDRAQRLTAHFATHSEVYVEEEESEKLWAARRAALPALTRYDAERPNYMLEDVTVPLSMVPSMLSAIRRIEEEVALPIPTFGHIGDGNLHPTILYSEQREDEKQRARTAVARLFEEALAMGGTLSGEHGIGLSKAGFMTKEHAAEELEAFLRIKQAFDPNGILNPGKMGLG